MRRRLNYKFTKVASLAGYSLLPKVRRGEIEDGVRWRDTGKKKQGFRDDRSLAHHQASQGWGSRSEHPRVWDCARRAFSQMIFSALSQQVLHCHFTDEETEAWVDA